MAFHRGRPECEVLEVRIWERLAGAEAEVMDVEASAPDGPVSRGEPHPCDRLSACRTTENSSLAETRSDGCGTVCPVAGLARTLPLQSRTGLRVRIACKGRRSTALALKRDVKPHPTRCEVGRNPKARSLARIQTLIRNASERER